MKITMEKFLQDLNDTLPAILVGSFGALVRFLYDGHVNKDFSFSRLISGLAVSALVIWTVSYLIDLSGYVFETQTLQLIYCWSGYTARDLAFVLSKRFIKFFQNSTNGEGK